MVPSIAQQLQSLRSTMAETIVPALPADAGFAQEQAGLMLATLDWLADVQAHAYRYEVIENADYRALLGEFEPLVAEGEAADAIRAALAEPAAPAAEDLVALDVVAGQNERMKALAEGAFLAAAQDGGEAGASARALLLRIAARQGERESAWFRMTGFPREPGEIGAVLAGT